MTRHEEGFFTGVSHEMLYYQAWLPEEKPRWILIIAHGLGEHGGRYAHVGAFFSEKGVAVFAPDLAGHGRSPGKQGHIQEFDLFSLDLERLREQISSDLPDLPVVLLGHSMGGLVALNYALHRQDNLAALILSAPVLGLRMKTPKLQVKAAKVLVRFMPSMTLNNNLKAEWLSHDPAIVDGYKNDPLVHPKISLSLFITMRATMNRCLAEAATLRIPVLLVFGGDDPIVSFDAAHQAFEKFSSHEKKLLFYEKALHEVHNEFCKTEEFEAVWQWLDKILKTYAAGK